MLQTFEYPCVASTHLTPEVTVAVFLTQEQTGKRSINCNPFNELEGLVKRIPILVLVPSVICITWDVCSQVSYCQ